ncbi:NAD(P)-binding protein [Meredithblackwellia eburnea MCA 4105]
MSQHGVAVLGAGIFAREAHLPALAKTTTLTLKAVYSRSSKSVQALLEAVKTHDEFSSSVEAYSDDVEGKKLDDLLKREDIKTVILSLPIPIQPSVIEKAWKAGKNVVSEKPVAKDVKESKRLIDLWEKEYKPKGINWIIAEQYPYAEAYIQVKKLIADGKIGELRNFELRSFGFVPEGSKYAETEWRKVPDYQGGFLLDGGVHFAAGLRYMLPPTSQVTSVLASSTLIHPRLLPFDTLTGSLKTSSSAVGTFFITHATESRGPQTYSFRGSKGSIDLGIFDHKVVVSGIIPMGGKPETEEFSHEVRWIPAEFEAFGHALVGGIDSDAAKDVDSRTGPRACLRDVQFIENALLSGEKGSWINLD